VYRRLGKVRERLRDSRRIHEGVRCHGCSTSACGEKRGMGGASNKIMRVNATEVPHNRLSLDQGSPFAWGKEQMSRRTSHKAFAVSMVLSLFGPFLPP